jgi:hypothetical protein
MSEDKKKKLIKEINLAKKNKQWSLSTKLKRKLNGDNTKNEMFNKLKKDLEKNTLNEDNKGYKLLLKMGFKKGEGLDY